MVMFLIASFFKKNQFPHFILHVGLLPKAKCCTFSFHLYTEGPKSLCELWILYQLKMACDVSNNFGAVVTSRLGKIFTLGVKGMQSPSDFSYLELKSMSLVYFLLPATCVN